MPDELWRTFIAVKIASTPPLCDVLAQLAAMTPAVRPVAAENLHVTLKFLGDTPVSAVPAISAAVSAAASGKAGFEAHLLGLGAFPHPGRPSVVWVGLTGAETLIDIAAQLKKPLKQLGFAPEPRPFAPHLTVARVRSRPPPELQELLAARAAADFGTALIRRVELMRSELRPEGSKYTVLHAVALGEPGGNRAQ